MLKNLKTYLEYGTRFCGIEHTFQNGNDAIYAIVLKKTKNNVDIESSFKESSLDVLISKLQKKQAIYLIINDDNVLTKRIESKQTDVSKIVYNAFPNINLEDFFHEVITEENSQFVSICRKVYVEELIAKYKTNGLCIINISLGSIIASNVIKFVTHKTLLTSNAGISIENNIISAIDKIELKETIIYDINGLQVNNHQLLSFSGALDCVLQNFNPSDNFGLLKQKLIDEYKQSRFYTQFLKFGLIFILSALLINFFVFNHYFEAVNTLQETSQINQITKEKILDLNKSVNKSQKMVDDMLKSSTSKSSFYVNTIIQGLPNSILLSELNYQPILKRIKTGQPIEISINTILVSGESNNSESFSKWIADLERIDWISKVEVLNYEDTSKATSNFSIKLTLIS